MTTWGRGGVGFTGRVVAVKARCAKNVNRINRQEMSHIPQITKQTPTPHKY